MRPTPATVCCTAAVVLISTGAFVTQAFLSRASARGAASDSGDVPIASAATPDSAASPASISTLEVPPLPDALPLMQVNAVPPALYEPATLWLARCIYSETKKPREQRLVAWVVRNRVETEYRGADTYREVVLDPFQFSAFNPGSGRRYFLMNLDATSRVPGWQRALHIAYRVRHMPDLLRPFAITTRHFFSQRSMPGGRFPDWANQRKLVSLERFQIDQRRFRFYKGIS